MAHIKCVYPRNFYLLRSISIRVNNEIVARIGHNDVIEIKEAQGEVKFRIDYHHAIVDIHPNDMETYLIIYFQLRDYFPMYYVDIMFKNCLRAKIVSQAEFEQFNETFYNEPHDDIGKFGATEGLSLLGGSIISVGMILVPFTKPAPGDIDNFIFYMGVLSLIGFTLTLSTRKKIRISIFYKRLLFFSLFTFLFFLFIHTSTVLRLSMIALSLIVVITSAYSVLRK